MEFQSQFSNLKARLGESLCAYGHPNPVSCICTHPQCKQRFLCLNCILSQPGHLNEHRSQIIEVGLFLERIVLKSHWASQLDQDKEAIQEEFKRAKGEIACRDQSTVEMLSEDLDELQRKVNEEFQRVKESILKNFERKMEKSLTLMKPFENEINKMKNSSEITQERLELCSKALDSMSIKGKPVETGIYERLEQIQGIESKYLGLNSLVRGKWKQIFESHNLSKAKETQKAKEEHQKSMESAYNAIEGFLESLKSQSLSIKKKELATLGSSAPLKEILFQDNLNTGAIQPKSPVGFPSKEKAQGKSKRQTTAIFLAEDDDVEAPLLVHRQKSLHNDFEKNKRGNASQFKDSSQEIPMNPVQNSKEKENCLESFHPPPSLVGFGVKKSEGFSLKKKEIEFALSRSYNNMVSSNFSLKSLVEGSGVYFFTGWNPHDYIRVDLGEERFVERVIIKAPIYNHDDEKDLRRINGAVLQIMEGKHWVSLAEIKMKDSASECTFHVKRRGRHFQILHGEKMPVSLSLGIGKLKFE